MQNKFTYNLVLAHSSDGGSKSKYSGGFKTVNGRKNNTSEYNHDYYQKNKHKWNKKAHSGRPVGEATSSGTVQGRDPNPNRQWYTEGVTAFNSWDHQKKRWVQSRDEFIAAYNRRQAILQNGQTDLNGERGYSNLSSANEHFGKVVLKLGDQYDHLSESDARDKFYRLLNREYDKRK